MASLARASNPPTSSVGSASAYPLACASPRTAAVFGAALHLAEDEITGPVQDAFDALDPVAGEALLQPGNHGYPACHGRAVFQMAAPRRCQPFQFNPVKGDQLLVRRDHGFARLKRPPDPATCRIEAAHQFHDHVGAGGQHRIRIFAPDDAVRGPIHPLALHAAVEYVGQFQPFRLRLRQDARHGASHGSEPEQCDAQRPQSLRILPRTTV